jgi:glycosyltransferase involved in cell wall biosynthesis
MSAEPVRTLFLVSTLGIGGAEKHVITLANGLDRGRFAISLAYLKPDEALLSQLDRTRLDAVLSLNVQRRIDWQAVRVLTEHVDRLGVDVIVCTNEYPTVYGLLAARRARRRPKLVEFFHTTTFGTIKNKLQMWVYRQIFSRFELLVYVSRNQQAYWRAKGLHARGETVIHNGIDCEHFTDTYTRVEKSSLRSHYAFTDADYLVGICAALRPEKAHVDLLRAIAMLQARSLPARCMIIGDGPERPRIEAQIKQYGLTGSVAITGFKADVRPYIACCDAIVLASHSVETFSIAALESMALGKAVVLSRVGGADEQITNGENGYLFDAGKIEQLADRLQDLSAESTRTRLGMAAAARVRREFTREIMLVSVANCLTTVAMAED